MSAPTPLDQRASIPVLRRLVAAGAVPVAEGAALEQRLRRELPWAAWFSRGLLVLGVTLILCGIIYFFAHNWSGLTDNDKLVLAGGAIVAALIGGTWLGFDTFPGKVCLFAASFLVGGFIGVFSSIYQSTAEDWTVFAFWALLVTPWVVLGRFPALWIFWMAELNVSLFFYWQKFLAEWDFDPNSHPLERVAMLSLLLFNIVALAVREIAVRRGIAWVDRGWSALALVALIYAIATAQIISEIVASTDGTNSIVPSILGLLVYAALAGLTYLQFARVRPSLPALALGMLGVCVTLTTFLGRLLFADVKGDPVWQMLFMGLLTLGIFGAGVYLLRAAGRQFNSTRRVE